MTTIAHLSDLHFGTVDEAMLEPLRAALHSAKPQLLAISGDLTQRAKIKEFQAARNFLDSLPFPRLVVPGNHDVPIYGRLVRNALARYKRLITANLDPHFEDGTVSVVGVNTARAFAFKNGRISHEQIETVRHKFDSCPDGVCKILVVHHPLDVPRAWKKAPEATRARLAFEQWFDCGVDVILAGHEHRAHATNEAERLRIGTHSAIMVQAGTAISTRLRGEANSFNLLHIDGAAIVVERKTWSGKSFDTTHKDRFER